METSGEVVAAPAVSWDPLGIPTPPPPRLIPLLPASTLGLLIGVLVLGDLQSQAGQVK